MPPRYQQGQLASPAVGVPGLDTAAGAVEKTIADKANQFAGQAAAVNQGIAKADTELKLAQGQQQIRQLAQSEQDFNQARGQFWYYGQQREAAQRRQEALEKAERDEQRLLQVQLDRIDEDDRLNEVTAGIKAKYANNPYQAVKEFENQLPVLRQEFQSRHSDDEKRLRMLMPSQRAAEKQILSHLNSWATSTTTQMLNKRVQLLPDQLTEKISGLTGYLDEQIMGFNKHLAKTNSIYTNLYASAVDDAHRDLILDKQIKLNHDAGQQFINHLFTQTPDGQDGIAYLDGVGAILKNAKQNGISLEPKDQEQLIEHARELRNAHEQEVITGIRSDSDLGLLRANGLKSKLYQAANSPKELAALAMQVQSTYKDLEGKISLVEQEPDSKIKNAKLVGLKQQQNALISEMGLDLKLVRSFEQLQRSLQTFAQGQIKFAQGQQRFEAWVRDRELGLDNKAANEQKVKELEKFNNYWGSVTTALNAALSEPAGAKQQAAISNIVSEAVPTLNSYMASGTLKAEHHAALIEQLTDQTKKASYKQTSKNWFGGEQVHTLSGKAKQKAIEAAQAQIGAVVKKEQGKFLTMQSAMTQLDTLTTSKEERAVLRAYAAAHLPTMLNSKRYQSLSTQQQGADVANAIKSMVTQFRQGTLR